MEIFLLYLWTRLGAVSVIAFVLAFGGLAGAIICAVASAEPYPTEATKPWVRRFAILSVVGAFCMIVIPTQKDAALILAGAGILEVAKSETAGRLASKSVQLIEQTLDGYLKQPEKK